MGLKAVSSSAADATGVTAASTLTANRIPMGDGARGLSDTGAGTIGTSLAIAGATIGTNALAVTGTAVVSGELSAGGGTIGGTDLMMVGAAGAGFTVLTGGSFIRGYTAGINVGANGNTTGIQNYGTGAGANMSLARYSNDATGLRIAIAKSRATAIGSLAIVQSGDSLGDITWAADDGTDLISKAASIVVTVDGTPGVNDLPGAIDFQVTLDGQQAPTSRMRINNAGVVQFGGTTSGSPALKASSTVLQARLADDSAFAPLQGSLRTSANATTGLTAGVLSALTNASIVITDASGQAYRIPCII